MANRSFILAADGAHIGGRRRASLAGLHDASAERPTVWPGSARPAEAENGLIGQICGKNRPKTEHKKHYRTLQRD